MLLGPSSMGGNSLKSRACIICRFIICFFGKYIVVLLEAKPQNSMLPFHTITFPRLWRSLPCWVGLLTPAKAAFLVPPPPFTILPTSESSHLPSPPHTPCFSFPKINSHFFSSKGGNGIHYLINAAKRMKLMSQ